MLTEALAWLLTPCSREARRLGYLAEAIALERRARRCRSDWAPHLARSREFLLDAAGPGGGTGVILGSGLLLDIPLAELAPRFSQLWLVDMLHLPQVRRQATAHPRVHLLCADVTGVVAPLAACPRGVALDRLERCFAAPPGLPPGGPAGPIDWVASVNLFSQLPLLPLAWAERLQPAIDEARYAAWQAGLLAAHLDWLARLAPRGCLLADGLQETLDAQGRVLEMTDYQPALAPLGQPAAAWEWQLAPLAETGRGQQIRHQVQAWRW